MIYYPKYNGNIKKYLTNKLLGYEVNNPTNKDQTDSNESEKKKEKGSKKIT